MGRAVRIRSRAAALPMSWVGGLVVVVVVR
jgi:hypothetical protein